MFSAFCQSELLTADCFCIELSGDDEFKASLAGQLSAIYETLRFLTWKSNVRSVLEVHDSFSGCPF